MGFAGLFSTKSESTQYVTNKQIGQNGANSIALSGDVAGGLEITTNDPEIALAAINASGQNQMRALEALQSVGDRFAGVAETAVAGAQATALNALPLTPEQIAASRGDATAQDTKKTLVTLAAIAGGAILLLVVIKKIKP